MNRFLIAFLLMCMAVFIVGCGEEEKAPPGTEGYKSQGVTDEKKSFTLDEVVPAMEAVKMEDIIRIPREQRGTANGEEDPVELAIASLGSGSGSESVVVAFFYTPEDAQDFYKIRQKELDKKPKGESKDRTKITRRCNAVITYTPGNNLTNLKYEDAYKELDEQMKQACETPDSYKLGDEPTQPEVPETGDETKAAGEGEITKKDLPEIEPAPAPEKSAKQ